MTRLSLKKIFLFLSILLTIFFSLPKNTLAQNNFGFNVHSLSKTTPENITSILNYLKDECQTTIVRFWGYQSTLGINGDNDIQKVLDAAPSGMKFIIALEDFSYGPAINNPSSWFESGYKTSYRPYVEKILNKYGHDSRILVWEIMNEPHCKGDPNCFPHFKNFVADISTLINSKTSSYVSPGLMGGHLTWAQYEEISQLPNITANSCHYNANTNNPNTCLEALNHRSGTNFFYVGEAGYQGEGNCSGGACTNSNCTNCCDLPVLQKRADQVKNDLNTLMGAGANAFLIWQFSPKGSSTLICDSFSVFPKDPICNGTGDLPRLLEPIVISDASYVCSDKEVTHTSTEESPFSPPSPSPANNNQVLGESDAPDNSWFGGDFTGTVEIALSKISKFEPLQKSVSGALTKLLPQELSQNIVLPETVTMNFYHRILGQDEEGNFTSNSGYISPCDSTPCGKVNIPPENWGKLAGSTRGLYSFLYPPDPSAPVSKFQFQIAPAENPCQDNVDVDICSSGKNKPEATNLPEIIPEKTGFTLNAFFKKVTEIFEQITNEISSLFTKTTTTKKIKVLSRSLLPGGGETAENAKFFNTFIPEEIIQEITPKNKTKSLAADYQYEIGLSPSESIETTTFYYELEKIKNSSCIGLCSQLPSGVNIKDINPVCPSCNPSDYKSE